MAKPRRRRRIIIKPIHDKCPFCESKKVPDYKDYESLSGYLTHHAKIMPTSRSGICARHQRSLSLAIKRARHLALLPHVGEL
jgi:small subunit ribosomal protein S18